MQMRALSGDCLLVTAMVLVLVVAAGTAAQQKAPGPEIPFLSHGSVQETYVNITVHARPGDHCVLYWGISRGMTHLPLPAHLGGEVMVGLDPAWLLNSTLEGGISFNENGTWTFRIPHMDMIRELVDSLYFQVLVFRPGGTGLVVHPSEVLEIRTHESATPKSGLDKALGAPKTTGPTKAKADKPEVYLGKRRGPLGGRKVRSNTGSIRLDPFGNIIRQPGTPVR